MSSKKKQETRFSLDSPVMRVIKEPISVSSRTRPQAEKPVVKPEKPPPIIRNFLPYIPPDVLMFALFSAIQRKAWPRARKLCYELMLCDPLIKTYRDLYYRIDHIIKLIDQRIRPKHMASKAATIASRPASGSSSSSSDHGK
ncbi:unnamed protein product [Rotaria socialis]|uniref:Uncharacterized protein n=1 Tax=Rotaria socialis TaxID=392032 RepID=A0A821SBF8_9BILA|nr:unnamed protein product [Rotaria socialis]CAF3369500.1 unnamed protein product [Rotaria socialis]CAF3646098.1 unnamed protein product [Rotaria socialis]CAF3657773.1 unnamed protein product [Rotaria socialis]CAF3720434.1 unnamed protein product [Rotaria socialis]